MDEHIFDIAKPIIYDKDNNYLIFKDTTFDKIDNLDCNDGIEGICYTNSSLEKCIQLCETDGTCASGYYVKTDNYDYCVPITSDTNMTLNMDYKLRNKILYPELNNIESIAFINTKKYIFPPDEANLVFFNDILTILNVKDNTTPSIKKFNEGTKNIPVIFDFTDDLSIRILPVSTSVDLLISSIPIKYGDGIKFVIPDTSLAMTYNLDIAQYTWTYTQIYFGLDSHIIFDIIPVDDKNKSGDNVKYGDLFYIKYKYTNILYLQNGNLYRSSDFYDKIKDTKNIIFTFKSKMNGFYCNNGKCETIELDKMDKNGQSGRYKNNIVFKNQGCFGTCKYTNSNINNNIKPNNKSKIYIVIYILLTIFLVYILFIIIKKIYSKIKK